MELSDDLRVLDRPEILQWVFWPKRSHQETPYAANAISHRILVEDDVFISCRFYFDNEKSPNILFFHGNGEIAPDYDQSGVIYTLVGINFFVADYRGYGLSDGIPTISNMIKDAHSIYQGFKHLLEQRGYSGSIFVMGRSLGNISAVELASQYQDQIKGLIMESAGADMVRGLARRLGVAKAKELGLTEGKFLSNVKQVRSISIPTLIIHGEKDDLVSVENAQELYENAAAEDKLLVLIPKASHNDIFLFGMKKYFQTVKEFVFAHN